MNFLRRKDEGFDEVAKSFDFVAKVEATHHQILEYLSTLFNANKMYKRKDATEWKCSNCGHTEIAKEAWKECPLCQMPQGFVIIDFEHEFEHKHS